VLNQLSESFAWQLFGRMYRRAHLIPIFKSEGSR
jgi:hypothetical protein